MPRLTVIIVNYNVRSYLEQSLLSVLSALQHISSEIIVVDNASTDGSVEMVRSQFPGVNFIVNDYNVGFACANNMALQRVQGEFIVLLNPDTLVRRDTFTVLLDSFSKFPESGMIGGKILNEDGSLQLSCRRSFPTPWVSFARLTGLSRLFPKSRTFAQYNLTFLDQNEWNEVDAVSGSFMAIRKKVLKDVGYLDERFFMYGEDIDWCYRIKQAGWKIIYEPRAVITHFMRKSSREYDWDHTKHFYTAMRLFAEKHFRSNKTWVPFWLIDAGISIIKIAAYLHTQVMKLWGRGEK